MLARFIPAVMLGLVAIGLLIGSVSPAWWITALVAVGLAVVALVRMSSARSRFGNLAPFVPALIAALVATGLLIGAISPAWWITALIALALLLFPLMRGR